MYRIRKQLSGRTWTKEDESPPIWVFSVPLLAVLLLIGAGLWLDWVTPVDAPQALPTASYVSYGRTAPASYGPSFKVQQPSTSEESGERPSGGIVIEK